MFISSHGERVGYKLGTDGGPRLAFLVLPGVRVHRDDSNHMLSGDNLKSVDRYLQLHQVIIDLPTTRLHDVHTFPPHRLTGLHISLPVCKLLGHHIGKVDTKPFLLILLVE